MKPTTFVLVYLNDSRVFGPFGSVIAAEHWARSVPNKLFKTMEQHDHADGNGDFWTTELEEQ